MKIKDTLSDRVFTVFCYAVVILVAFVCLYPLWLVLIYSISDPDAVNAGKVWLWPVGVTWDAYKEVFAREDLMKGYWNTITQTLFGTAVNMVMTIPAAYALSKSKLKGRGFFMGLIVFTMYFSGGLIPNFINLKNLHLLNTWWVFGLCGAVSSYNLIVARTFFASGIPHELEEAAEIDGAGHIKAYFQIAVPLCSAAIVVVTLFSFVWYWNEVDLVRTYLGSSNTRNTGLTTLMLELNKFEDSYNAVYATHAQSTTSTNKLNDAIKMAGTMLSVAPMMILYFFLQKQFVESIDKAGITGE